jgi:ABC-type multidrug transport system ATPase subunit
MGDAAAAGQEGIVSASVLEGRDLHRRFGRTDVLRGAALAVRPGQLVAVLGENGSGKSTLLRILAGVERLDRGAVVRRGRVGYSPQDALLHPHLTPDEHVDLFAAAYGLPRDVARTRAGALMDRFGLAPHRKKLVHRLSGGTRQKLNLTLALLHEPPILLLDEPYAGLDAAAYERVVAWIDEARAAGTCVVLVTHILFDRSRFDAVKTLADGRLSDA